MECPQCKNPLSVENASVCEWCGNQLPNKDELDILYKSKDSVGGFAFSSYWSSTEYDNYNAWTQYFYDGAQSDNGKDYVSNVRAVRAF